MRALERTLRVMRRDRTVPRRYWPTEDGFRGEATAPLTEQFLPLPPADGLSRWFWGTPASSNDGGCRKANRVLVFVGAAAGSFDPSDLRRLLRDRRGIAPSPHTIIVAGEGAAPEAAAVLRRCPDSFGIALVVDPSSAQLSSLFSITSAVFVSAPDSCPPQAIGALASGVPVLPWDPGAPLPREFADLVFEEFGDDWREVGRRARQRARSSEAVPPIERTWSLPSSRPTPMTITDRPRRIVVAGHDFKFATAAVEALRSAGHEVRLDTWSGHARHDEQASRSLCEWADVVWCEWTLGNTVWYSNHVGPDTRLITRVHLQEAATEFPRRVNWAAVDATVVVAEHVRRQVVRDGGAPDRRTLLIPNMVRTPPSGEVAEKDPAARFRVGLVGMVPARKGLHEALEVIAALRRRDDRYTLSLRGKRPEEYPWMADRADERAYFEEQLARIQTDDRLRGAVTFSPFGPDMDAWYAGIGVVLSTSDFESFHFTVPDGAVHGAAPYLLDWPGADLLYPHAWLHGNSRDLAAAILADTGETTSWRARTDGARDFILRNYSESRVLPAFVEVVLGRAGTIRGR